MAQTNSVYELAIVEKLMKECWTMFKTTCSNESIDQTLGLRHSCHNSIGKLSDKWTKRLKEGDQIINKIQEYTDELCQKNKSVEEKQQKLSEVLSSTDEGEKEKMELLNSIQEFKEELARKSRTNSKAMEEKVERLNKANKLFKEWLGLEIRKTSVNRLQFIFRHIDHKDPDKPYTLSLSMNDEEAFEVISCSPPLDCMEELQRKLRETNNFSAFIANTRKAFIALSYK